MPEAYPIVLVYHIIHRKYTREIHNRSHWLASRAIKSHNSWAISASGPSAARRRASWFPAGATQTEPPPDPPASCVPSAGRRGKRFDNAPITALRPPWRGITCRWTRQPGELADQFGQGLAGVLELPHDEAGGQRGHPQAALPSHPGPPFHLAVQTVNQPFRRSRGLLGAGQSPVPPPPAGPGRSAAALPPGRAVRPARSTPPAPGHPAGRRTPGRPSAGSG